MPDRQPIALQPGRLQPTWPLDGLAAPAGETREELQQRLLADYTARRDAELEQRRQALSRWSRRRTDPAAALAYDETHLLVCNLRAIATPAATDAAGAETPSALFRGPSGTPLGKRPRHRWGKAATRDLGSRVAVAAHQAAHHPFDADADADAPAPPDLVSRHRRSRWRSHRASGGRSRRPSDR